MKTNLLENALLGFDEILSQIHKPYSSYPPYNVLKTESGYELEIAVAGFDKQDLEVQMVGSELVIKGTKSDSSTHQYLYQGLAHRSWCRRFVLDPQLTPGPVTLTNGVLKITFIHKTTHSTKLEIL